MDAARGQVDALAGADNVLDPVDEEPQLSLVHLEPLGLRRAPVCRRQRLAVAVRRGRQEGEPAVVQDLPAVRHQQDTLRFHGLNTPAGLALSVQTCRS